jgi:hypothetical protein
MKYTTKLWIGAGVVVLVVAIVLIVVFTTRKSGGGGSPSNPCAPVLKSVNFDAGRSVLVYNFASVPATCVKQFNSILLTATLSSAKDSRTVSHVVDLLAIQGEVSTGLLPPGQYSGTASITFQGASPLSSDDVSLNFAV